MHNNGHGAGGDIMRRIAGPMIGGIGRATVLALVVIPAVYFLWNLRIWSEEAYSLGGGLAPAE